MFKSVLSVFKPQINRYGFLRHGQRNLLIPHPSVQAFLNISNITKSNFASASGSIIDRDLVEAQYNSRKSATKTNINVNKVHEQIAAKVNNAIHVDNANVSNSPQIKQLLRDIRGTKTQLNFFDSLLFLSIIRQVDPTNTLVRDFDKIFAEAHRALKEAISNAEMLQSLYENNDIIKLVIFLGDNVGTNSDHPPKKVAIFKKITLTAEMDTAEILKYFTTKYGLTNNSTYPPNVKPIVIDILKVAILALKDLEMLKDVPEQIRQFDFQLSKNSHTNLLAFTNILDFTLGNSRTEAFNLLPCAYYFLNSLTQVCYLTELSLQISTKVLDLMTTIRGLNVSIMEFGEPLLFACTVVKNNIHTLNTERFTRILFMMTRLNLSNFNNTIYGEFIEKAAAYVVEKQNEFTTEQLKSNLYALGYNSVWTPELQQVYDKLCDLKNIQSKKDYKRFSLYLRNLLLSSINTFALKNDEKLKKIIDYIIHEVRMHDHTSQYFDLASFMKISLALRRIEYKDLDFWRIFFNTVPEIFAREKGASFELHFALKSIDLFARDEVSKEEYKEIYGLLQNFAVEHARVYAEIMNSNVKELAKSLPESTQEVESGLHHQIKLYLDALNLKYEEEAASK